jgi:predicted anti-sigma-YlaC factor YlaD
MDSAPTRSTTSLPSTLKADNTTMPMLFHDNHAKECTHCRNIKAQADINQVQATAAVAAAGWDPVTLRTELNDYGTGPILEDVETGQRSEWKDISNCRPTYKSY